MFPEILESCFKTGVKRGVTGSGGKEVSGWPQGRLLSGPGPAPRRPSPPGPPPSAAERGRDSLEINELCRKKRLPVELLVKTFKVLFLSSFQPL